MRKPAYIVGGFFVLLFLIALILPDPAPTAKEASLATQTKVSQTTPTPKPDPIPTGNPPDQTVPADRPVETPEPTPEESNNVYYATCSDAPGKVYRGDPGYRSEMDRDGDGIACESN